jgi:hypothetical protein
LAKKPHSIHYYLINFYNHEIGFGQFRLLRPSQLPVDQIVKERQPGRLVQVLQIGLDLAGLHQVKAGQQNPVHVQQGFDAWRAILLERAVMRARRRPPEQAREIVDDALRDWSKVVRQRKDRLVRTGAIQVDK